MIMGYAIPDKIKYKEKIFLNLDLKQLGYLIGFLILSGIAYSLPLMEEAKMVLAFVLILVGLGFALFDLETKLRLRWLYLTNVRLGGALDKKVREFIGVKKIERSSIFLKNGEIRAVLQVKPINFELLDDTRKRSLILNYREFLNQLTFPIQILIRTVNAIKPDYSHQDLKIEKSNNTELKSLYHEFRLFEERFIQDYLVKERLYYIVIPMENKRTVIRSKIKEEEQIRELNQRVALIQERLGYSGIVTFRLDTSQLISLLMSYFEPYVEVGDDYLSRITVYNLFNTNKEVR